MKKKKTLLTVLTASLTSAACALLISCTDDKTVRYEFSAEGATIEDIVANPGDTVTLPTPPARDGYIFLGWYTNAELTGEPVTSITAETNATFYAKWEKLAAITLNLDGGSLSSSAVVYAKAGSKAYDAVKDLKPTKAGLTFGAWFVGSTELTETSETTVQDGMTLVAKYKVGYTVEIYRQKLDKSGYEKDEEATTGLGYVGGAFTAPSFVGFTEVNKTESKPGSTLSGTASENAFVYYFDRNDYNFTFETNYPDGANNTRESHRITFGQSLRVPSTYTYEGYLLAGWSESPTASEATYAVDAISALLYNKDGSEPTEVAEEVQFGENQNPTLYAVWKKGYTDMFGGRDSLYLLSEDSDVIYRSRGDVFFKGRYTARNKTFTFGTDDPVRGRLNDDGTFIYVDENRSSVERTPYLFQVGKGLDESVWIRFDEFDGIEYTDHGEISKGTFTIDEGGYYHLTFTEGQKAGETIVFVIGTVSSENTNKPAFQIRDEYELELGKLIRFGFDSAGNLSYYPTAYDITLNGFGVASYNTGNGFTQYRYVREGDVVTLRSSSGALVADVLLMENNGRKGYMIYTWLLDQKFTLESGATLEFDGACNVVYQNGSESFTGYYFSNESVFGGFVVTFGSGAAKHTFLITYEEVVVPAEDEFGEDTTKIEYTVTEKLSGYAEYYYRNEENTYRTPILVVDDEEEGYANIYALTTGGAYQIAQKGTVTAYGEDGSLFRYQKTANGADEAFVTVPLDILDVEEIVFAVDNTLAAYQIYYWHSAKFGGQNESTSYAKTYEDENGATLVLASGVAFHELNTNTNIGLYTILEDGIVDAKIIRVGGRNPFYAELDDEHNTFTMLEYAPYRAYLLKADGTEDRNIYLAFDGKGGAYYTTVTKDASGNETVTKVYGKVTEDVGDTSVTGETVSRFTAADNSLQFDWLLLTNNTNSFFTRENETYTGEYETQTDGGLQVLLLDGFGFNASFTDSNGVVYTGRYSVPEENVVRMSAEGRAFYFDLKANKTFTLRGKEYGVYNLMKNGSLRDTVFELDGYGKMKAFTVKEDGDYRNEEDRIYLDEAGTYTVVGDRITLRYQVNGAEEIVVGETKTITVDSQSVPTFTISQDDVVMMYVNEKDWSILLLDALGGAIKYNTLGVRETGSYVLITDNLLYFVNDANSDAYIYEYDIEGKTATPIRFQRKSYCTENLDTLYFSEYGFAYLNGVTRYYYNIEGDTVYIYHEDENSKEKYGFVKEAFGKFDEVKEYDGQTYYLTESSSIEFLRKTTGNTDYPLVLTGKDGTEIKYNLESVTFAPTGRSEFSASARLEFSYTDKDGKTQKVSQNGSVVRTVDESGKVTMYAALGYYRFYMNVNYAGGDMGADNRFEVTGLRSVQTTQSYRFFDNLYNYYLGAMQDIDELNQDDRMEVVRIYDAEGKETSCYASGTFDENSFIRDRKGNILSFEEQPFVYDEGTGVYTVNLTGEDGEAYRLYFGFATHSAFGRTGYRILGFTLSQTLTAEGGYTVEIDRLISSDEIEQGTANNAGTAFSVELTKNGQKLTAEQVITLGDKFKLYFLIRTRSDPDNTVSVTSSTVYEIALTEDTDGLTGSEDDNTVLPYKTATVKETVTEVVHTDKERTFVEVNGDEIIMITYNRRLYFVMESTYDEATQTYTVKTSQAKTFTVKITDGTATVTEVK